MADLSELYQQVIIDHSQAPHNFHRLEQANHHHDGFNPLCGDRITVYLQTDGEKIQEISFQGSGCAIATASASMMTDALQGMEISQALELFAEFQKLVTGDPNADLARLGKLAVFGGVKEFPMRIKCATLAWHALKAALASTNHPTTEGSINGRKD